MAVVRAVLSATATIAALFVAACAGCGAARPAGEAVQGTPAGTPAGAAATVPHDGNVGAMRGRSWIAGGVVLAERRDRVFVMRPGGGIDAVAVDDGEVAWTTEAASRPVSVVAGELLAQAETSTTGTLTLVRLSPDDGGELGRFDVPLVGCAARIDDGMGTTFFAHGTDHEAGVVVHWGCRWREVGGVPSNRGGGAEGWFLLLPGGGFQPLAEAPLREPVTAGILARNEAQDPPTRIDGVLAWAGPVLAENGSRFALRHWDPATGRQVLDQTLPDDSAALSVDGQWVFATQRSANPEQERWRAFDPLTGELRAERDVALRIQVLTLAGDVLLGRDVVSVEPLNPDRTVVDVHLLALELDREAIRWRHPVRDTEYRGPFPP